MTEEIMANLDDKEILELWDNRARDWDIQVGDDGDSNRILNSDPVLWSFAGNVAGLSVLDAGCGTGYLARQLCLKGASVTGIDFSPQMIEIAQFRASQNNLDIDFHLDSCTELKSLADEQFDMIISNYVLMDLLDLEGAIRAFNRVLKPSGIAILVFSYHFFVRLRQTLLTSFFLSFFLSFFVSFASFAVRFSFFFLVLKYGLAHLHTELVSHPCFPQGNSTTVSEDGTVFYSWASSYFERTQRNDQPWNHFTTSFIWFHRPLSDYWKAFKAAGFSVDEFEEPRITTERYHLAENDQKLFNSKTRPYSVVFKLLKVK
ncbi:class I SAM-dependent methyltransferase [Nostoc favosum]|uniref:Class I SAM-dependent methyltransferase n=1 Tax=Nostoc favosum CHAB5714 TaxID=2780399 RepID=A0ABS8IIM1_9NOSO|nr:class I SAM-dependent methyltransferase [Nostoc favosum]MCC5604044.1 class I SAM-dependent methyltransferase [Nostoc favosum CHAB5714]